MTTPTWGKNLDNKEMTVTLTYAEWVKVRSLVRVACGYLGEPQDELIENISWQNVRAFAS